MVAGALPALTTRRPFSAGAEVHSGYSELENLGDAEFRGLESIILRVIHCEVSVSFTIRDSVAEFILKRKRGCISLLKLTSVCRAKGQEY